MGSCGGNTGRIPQTTQDKTMSTLTINMPEGLAKQLRACAADEGVTVDQFIASAAGEKLSALMTLDHLRERAAPANRQDFIDFLEGSPDVPPMPGDEL
jgi:hypothetical protein